MNNILVLSNGDVSVTCITYADFKLVAETRQRPTVLSAVGTERTAAPTTVVLYSKQASNISIFMKFTN